MTTASVSARSAAHGQAVREDWELNRSGSSARAALRLSGRAVWNISPQKRVRRGAGRAPVQSLSRKTGRKTMAALLSWLSLFLYWLICFRRLFQWFQKSGTILPTRLTRSPDLLMLIPILTMTIWCMCLARTIRTIRITTGLFVRICRP